jgi:nitronate monooxygenase
MKTRKQTDLSLRLKLDGPLIQAPLSGGPSTAALTAAASNAGALGSIGGAYLNPNDLQKIILETKKLTSRSFGVNLFAPAKNPELTSEQIQEALRVTRPYRQELGLPDPKVESPFHEAFGPQFEVILREKPAVFSFTFGMVEREVIRACAQAGILTMGTATHLEEAMKLEELGVDAVVAQGLGAGGHRGMFTPEQADSNISTYDLVTLLVKNLRIPVAASGGIMNGEGIAEVLNLGAQAAHLGTAFLLCDEAGTSAPYRKALTPPNHTLSHLTRSFSGRIARGMENRFLLEMQAHPKAILPFPAQNAFTRDLRRKSTELGRSDFLSLWAGEGIAQIRSMGASELVHTLFKEMDEAFLKQTRA